MRKLAVLATVLLLNFAEVANAQEPDEAAIRAVISQLFDGMRAGDSAAVRATFYEEATLKSMRRNREGQEGVRNTALDGFVGFIGAPHDDIYNEVVWDIEIRIDGNIGTAWMNFAFFSGETLSHCGVNSFQFLKSSEGWRTINLIDSRRPAARCEVPDRAM